MLSTITKDTILAVTQQRLLNLRRALEDAADLQSWASGVSSSDLVTAGFTSGDANSILSAIADANAMAQIYRTGQAPGTYPQVTGQPYPYAASQTTVIGPA